MSLISAGFFLFSLMPFILVYSVFLSFGFGVGNDICFRFLRCRPSGRFWNGFERKFPSGDSVGIFWRTVRLPTCPWRESPVSSAPTGFLGSSCSSIWRFFFCLSFYCTKGDRQEKPPCPPFWGLS